MAVDNRPPGDGLIFHSDRGVQYACNKYGQIMKNQKAIRSMSRKGNCRDNAAAESFFTSLKVQLVYQ
jgi:putative transposase